MVMRRATYVHFSVWSFLAGLNYCATLQVGLYNPMENVQVHDLMCYCIELILKLS